MWVLIKLYRVWNKMRFIRQKCCAYTRFSLRYLSSISKNDFCCLEKRSGFFLPQEGRKGGRGRTELWWRAERTVQESQTCCCQRNGWGRQLLILKWLTPCPKQQPWRGFQAPALTKQEAGPWMSAAHVALIVSAAYSWPTYISNFHLGYRKMMFRSLPCLIWSKELHLGLIL